MLRTTTMRAPLALVFALMAGAGCGAPEVPRPETTPVKGRVLYKGKPIGSGTISFVSDSGHTATGPIGAEGEYTLSTFAEGDGAVLGHHRVSIVANEQPIDVMPGSSPQYKPTKDLIPKKYADPGSSGLEATVSKGQESLDFDLK